MAETVTALAKKRYLTTISSRKARKRYCGSNKRGNKDFLLRIWKPFTHKQTAVPKLSYFDKYVFIVRILPAV